EHPDFLRRAGSGPQIFGTAVMIAWLMGRHDEAARRNEHCLTLSRSTGNPYDEAFALYMAAHHAVLTATPEEAEQLALRAIQLGEQHGYGALANVTRLVLGRARAGLGRAAEGASMVDDGVRGRIDGRRHGSDTMYLTWLAEAYAMAGDIAKAESAVLDALTAN